MFKTILILFTNRQYNLIDALGFSAFTALMIDGEFWLAVIMVLSTAVLSGSLEGFMKRSPVEPESTNQPIALDEDQEWLLDYLSRTLHGAGLDSAHRALRMPKVEGRVDGCRVKLLSHLASTLTMANFERAFRAIETWPRPSSVTK